MGLRNRTQQPFWRITPIRSADPAALYQHGIECVGKRDGKGMIATGWALCQVAGLHQYQAGDFLTDGYRIWRESPEFDRGQAAAFLADLFGALCSLTPPSVPDDIWSAAPEAVMPASIYYGTRCWAGNELLEMTTDQATRDQYEPVVFRSVAEAPHDFVPTRSIEFAKAYAAKNGLPEPWVIVLPGQREVAPAAAASGGRAGGAAPPEPTNYAPPRPSPMPTNPPGGPQTPTSDDGRAEQERAAREREERERQERAAREREEQERAERERAEREERERAERERQERERERAEREERERAERERQERERQEQERARAEQERAERERQERERAERERQEQERAERERQEQERARAEQERAEHERQEQERARAEQERVERERQEREKVQVTQRPRPRPRPTPKSDRGAPRPTPSPTVISPNPNGGQQQPSWPAPQAPAAQAPAAPPAASTWQPPQPGAAPAQPSQRPQPQSAAAGAWAAPQRNGASNASEQTVQFARPTPQSLAPQPSAPQPSAPQPPAGQPTAGADGHAEASAVPPRLADLRTKLLAWLSASYRDVQMEPNGWITIPDIGPSVIQIETSLVQGGHLKAEVFAPLVLDVPLSTELFRYVAMEGGRFHFGVISLDAGEDGSDELALLQFSHSLLADNLQRDELLAVVWLVAATIVSHAPELQRRFGGVLYAEIGR